MRFANPNDGLPWAQITNVTSTGFDITYAAFYIRNDMGGKAINRWIPADRPNIGIAYTAVGIPMPIISGSPTICGSAQERFTVSNSPPNAFVTWSSSPNIVINQSGVASRHPSISWVTQPGEVTATITIPGLSQPLILTQDVHVGTIPNVAHISTRRSDFPVFHGNCENEDMITYYGATPRVGNIYGVYLGEWKATDATVDILSYPNHPSIGVPGSIARFSVSSLPNSYQVEVGLKNQCGWSLPRTISYWRGTPCPTGPGDEIPKILNFIIHPNPAVDQFTIEFDAEEISAIWSRSAVPQTVDIRLFDRDGREVRRASWDTNRSSRVVQINTSNLREGTYYLHVESNGEINMEQIMVKRR